MKMRSNSTSPIELGNRSEQKRFTKRHRLFFKRFPNLKAAIDGICVRKVVSSEKADLIVALLGRLCVDDFMQILVLSGNGYGTGALKVLRQLYEKAVIASYLHKYPEGTDDFLDFFWVNQHRLGEAIKNTFGEDSLSGKDVDETKRTYELVLDRFMVPDCKKCGTTHLTGLWNKMDFVSMVREVDELGKLIVNAYYLPTQQTHIMIRLTLARTSKVEDDELNSVWDAQSNDADNALRYGHIVLLTNLEMQTKHFALTSLQDEVETCFTHYREIWFPGTDARVGLTIQ
jgi:hypothetical protein